MLDIATVANPDDDAISAEDALQDALAPGDFETGRVISRVRRGSQQPTQP